MKNALTFNEIAAMEASGKPLDTFGPGSGYPILAFELAGSDDALNDWLRSLPCPVIGLGDGAAEAGCDVVLRNSAKLGLIHKNVTAAPIAAMTLVQHLRAIENLPLEKALIVESLAYAAIQQGPEFKDWIANYEGGGLIDEAGPSLLTEINGNTLSIRLNRPKNYNAIGVDMRDALCEVLDMALVHGGFERIEITGSGKTFSIGGAVQEFGEISDPASAHWVRSLRLPATRLLGLRDKLHIHVNGAAIGAGAEIAAFAKHVTCASKAWFQLPELKYGLIPGAGGTVSIMNRIGRQRTAYMALTMEKVSAKTALEWGLVDEVLVQN